jgi:hypothetical protein
VVRLIVVHYDIPDDVPREGHLDWLVGIPLGNISSAIIVDKANIPDMRAEDKAGRANGIQIDTERGCIDRRIPDLKIPETWIVRLHTQDRAYGGGGLDGRGVHSRPTHDASVSGSSPIGRAHAVRPYNERRSRHGDRTGAKNDFDVRLGKGDRDSAA